MQTQKQIVVLEPFSACAFMLPLTLIIMYGTAKPRRIPIALLVMAKL